MPNTTVRSFTLYGWAVCIWILVVGFQYGYHISVLNQIQAVLMCKIQFSMNYPLPVCIHMSDFTFSAVTAVFTIGGLCGSLVANLVMDRWGRKGAVQISAICISVGSCLMGIAGSATLLGTGRYLVGIGSGIGMCVVPIFLAEIAPPQIRGNVGILAQLSIVIGIMVTQAMGLRLATPTQWRTVFFFSFASCTLQVLLSVFIVESPSWLGNHGRVDDKEAASNNIWGPASFNAFQDVEPLLEEPGAPRDGPQHVAITVPQLFSSESLRKPLAIVCLVMFSQQLSGINAVLYYSNDILSRSLPNLGPYVSLAITIVNFLMTFPPIVLVERMGRKQLLTLSISGAIVSLILVGYSLNSGLAALSSIAIMTFVMSFAIGLGPVPFVLIPEVSPAHAVSAISSVGLSMNWISNFIVGLLFLPIRDLLAGGDPTKEGRVFYVFGAILFFSSFILLKLYRGV